MAYRERLDVPYHSALADAFTVGDNYYCSFRGPTNVNRCYLWTGCNGNIPGNILPDGTPTAQGTNGHGSGIVLSNGYADGYPRPASNSSRQLQVLIGGHRCPVAAPPSMDLLPIDVTDLPDRSVARFGAMVTLIGDDIGLDDLALASGMTGREILTRLGRRFHRIYYAT